MTCNIEEFRKITTAHRGHIAEHHANILGTTVYDRDNMYLFCPACGEEHNIAHIPINEPFACADESCGLTLEWTEHTTYAWIPGQDVLGGA